MSTANPTFAPTWTVPDDATAPEPRPMRAPVFIQDAVSPFGKETLLLDILRKQSIDQ